MEFDTDAVVARARVNNTVHARTLTASIFSANQSLSIPFSAAVAVTTDASDAIHRAHGAANKTDRCFLLPCLQSSA